MRTLVAFLVLFACGNTAADTVVPSDRVTRWVNVRTEAVAGPDIAIVGHLHPGHSAQLLSETGSYYEVRLDDGTRGFVHKSWTRLIPESGANIRIASFNIQVFGKTKAGKPEVMAELASIARKYDAIEWSKAQFPQEDDFIALGDFNASYDFASPSDFAGSPIREEYIWIIPDDADTNFSPTTACAYDRIVMTTATQEDYAHVFGVDKSVSAQTVSDHFPVFAEFRSNADN